MNQPDNYSKDEKKALTSIRPAYTLCTQKPGDELNQMLVNHFLETLAEVSVSIAPRKTKDEQSRN